MMVAAALAAALTAAPEEYWSCSYLGFADALNKPVAVKYHLKGNYLGASLGGFDDFGDYRLVVNSKDMILAVSEPFPRQNASDQAHTITILIDKHTLGMILTVQSLASKTVDYRIGECTAPVRR